MAQHPDFAVEQSAPQQLDRDSQLAAQVRLPRSVTLVGRLIAEGEKPVAVTVNVQEKDGAAAPQSLAELLKAEAGADGRFKIERVAPGTYALAVLARSHAPDRVEATVGAAMRTFLVDGLRAGRGFPALVTYNTWFSHGVQINDGLVAREAHDASLVGVEVFQLDAGWYPGAGRTGRFDFTSGLGTWQNRSSHGHHRGLDGRHPGEHHPHHYGGNCWCGSNKAADSRAMGRGVNHRLGVDSHHPFAP